MIALLVAMAGDEFDMHKHSHLEKIIFLNYHYGQ